MWLHVVNTHRTRAAKASLAVEGMKILRGKVFEIAVAPEFEVWARNLECLAPVEKKLPANAKWTFPAASVTAVELKVSKAGPAAGRKGR